MLWLHRELQAGNYPNATHAREEFGVNRKTTLRDITFMKDRLRLPIEYHSKRHGYYYTKQVDRFPSIEISRRQLLAITVAHRTLQSYRGTPFEKDLVETFEAITAQLADTVTYDLNVLASSLSFSHAGFEVSLDHALFETLSGAVMARRQVSFEYAPLYLDGKYERRRVHPLHLVNVAGIWYCFAYDPSREGIRRFALARMRRLRELQQQFEPPKDFSVEKLMEESMGIFGGKPENVRLRFRGIPARMMQEHRWHPSQRNQLLESGQLEVKLKVAITPEFRSWIMRWSPEVQVMEPKSLRESVWEAAKKMMELNAG